jgi:hypothetical protein
LSFHVLLANGNHPDFGKANFITSKNRPKKINRGSISDTILSKNCSFSVFIFICVIQAKSISNSANEVLIGFSD